MAIAENPAEEAAMLRKGELIAAKLTEVYPEAPTGFLDHSDAFTLLVAVLLSAQSLDTKVNAVTPALFREAGTPATMRALGESRIRELIREVGLSPQKAANLAKLSAILVEQHDGEVPQSFELLEALPGVGHKTASVVMMQAFGHPAFPVDTHIHRLACRWGCGDAKSVDRTEKALKRWFPDPESWASLHTRIILFGREHCPARKHEMRECPVCAFAATDEALAANDASPNKFVAAKSHAHPFIVREGVDVKVSQKTDAKASAKTGGKARAKGGKKASAKTSEKDGDDSDEDFMPTAKKRKRVAAPAKKAAPRQRKPRTAAKPKQREPALDGSDGSDGAEGDTKPAAKRRKTARAKKGAAEAKEQAQEKQAQNDSPAAGDTQPAANGSVRTSARIRARKEGGK